MSGFLFHLFQNVITRTMFPKASAAAKTSVKDVYVRKSELTFAVAADESDQRATASPRSSG